jgi:hypothetical protein
VSLHALVFLAWDFKAFGLFLDWVIDIDTWMLVVRTQEAAGTFAPIKKVGL